MFTLKSRVKSILTAVFGRRAARLSSGYCRLGVEWLEGRELLAVLLWKGETSASWNDKRNWIDGESLAQAENPPQPTDTVRFTNASTTDCTLDVAATVAAIQIEGYTKVITLEETLRVKGGFLRTLTPGTENYTVTGKGNFIIDPDSTFTWHRGTMAGVTAAGVASGKTVVSAGATLNIGSDTAPQMDARLAGRELLVEAAAGPVAAGVVNFTSGQLYMQVAPGVANPNRAASVTNGGVFNITGTASAIVVGGPSMLFTNASVGRVEVLLNAENSVFTVNSGFGNQGTSLTGSVNVGRGHLRLAGGGAGGGTWSVATNQFLQFERVGAAPVPQFTWESGTTFLGDGWVQVRDAAVTIAKKANLTSPDLVSDARMFFVGGTIEAEATPDPTLRAVLVPKSEFFWSNGSIQGPGPGLLKLVAGAKLYIYGRTEAGAVNNPSLTGGWTVENNGSIEFGNNPRFNPGTGTRVDFTLGAVTVKNLGTGSITVRDNSNIRGSGAAVGTIQGLAGSVVKTANSDRSDFQVNTTGQGGHVLKVEAGSSARVYTDPAQQGTIIDGGPAVPILEPPVAPKKMMFRGPYGFDPFTVIGVTGALLGDGSVTASALQNDGEVLPGDTGAAGEITFNGNYTQTATGALAVELGGGGGAVGGTDYDRIVVTGAGNVVTLAGALNVALLPTLTAAVGDVFTIIDNRTDTDVSGRFERPEGGLWEENDVLTVDGWQFRINYTGKRPDDYEDDEYNDVTLTVLSLPPPPTPGTVGGRAWSDENRDGARDADELAVPGIQVLLLDESGTQVGEAVTDGSGNYQFLDVAAGTYRVRFLRPLGVSFTAKDAVPDDTIDSDADPGGYTDFFTLAPGGAAVDWDAGLRPATAG